MGLVVLPVRGITLVAHTAITCGRAVLTTLDGQLVAEFALSTKALLMANPFYADKPKDLESQVQVLTRSLDELVGTPVLVWRDVADYTFPLSEDNEAALLSEAQDTLALLRLAFWLTGLWTPAGVMPRSSIGLAFGEQGMNRRIFLVSSSGASVKASMVVSHVFVRDTSMQEIQQAIGPLHEAGARDDRRTLRFFRLFSDALEAPRPEQYLTWLTTALETLLIGEDVADVSYRLRLSVLCITRTRSDWGVVKELYRFRNSYIHNGTVVQADALALAGAIRSTLRSIVEWVVTGTHPQQALGECLDQLSRQR